MYATRRDPPPTFKPMNLSQHPPFIHTHTQTPIKAALGKSRLDELAGEELEALGVWEPLDRDRARRVRTGWRRIGMDGWVVVVYKIPTYAHRHACARVRGGGPAGFPPPSTLPLTPTLTNNPTQFFLRTLALQESSGPRAAQVDAELGLFLRQDERRLQRLQRANNLRIALLRRRVMRTAAEEVAVRAKVRGWGVW